jgi:DNA-binding IclR family transcriptional regulator
VSTAGERPWTFLTNHGHVLLALYRNPDLRQRDIARMVGITEGAVQRILADLQDLDYVTAERVGRRNHYAVDATLSLRHPLEEGHTVGELFDRLAPAASLQDGDRSRLAVS